MEVSKNFYLTEFVSREIHNYFGDYAINFIDPKLITLAQFVRDHFGKSVTINNWYDNGQYNLSGHRTPFEKVGATKSFHKYGKAIDVKISGLMPKEIYDHILSNEKVFMDAGLTTMENVASTISWNHLDIRHTGLDHILIVNP